MPDSDNITIQGFRQKILHHSLSGIPYGVKFCICKILIVHMVSIIVYMSGNMWHKMIYNLLLLYIAVMFMYIF